MHVFVVLVLY